MAKESIPDVDSDTTPDLAGGDGPASSTELAAATPVSERVPGISVVLPAWNEAAIIANSITRTDTFLRSTGLTYEILLGDDGSTDATVENALASGCTALRVISRPRGGKGAILTAALSAARGEYVGFIDSDLEIDIRYLDEFIRLLDGGADAVIARKTDREASRHRSMRRRLLTFTYNFLARRLFGTRYNDHQAGMKFFRRPVLERILPTIRSTGWIWDTEVLVGLSRLKAKVAEVSVTVSPVPDRIPKVGWIGTSIAMAFELRALRSRIASGTTPGRAAGTVHSRVDAR